MATRRAGLIRHAEASVRRSTPGLFAQNSGGQLPERRTGRFPQTGSSVRRPEIGIEAYGICRRILVAVMPTLHDVVRYPRMWTSARWNAGGTE